jgi:HAD superfamily hydrolase (TIGR01549 family)
VPAKTRVRAGVHALPGDLRGVFFDLDGTLLDSFRSHLAIYKATLAEFGVALDAKRFRSHYSPNWNEFYRRVGLAPEHWEAASVEWLRRAAGHEPRLFPGVAAALRRLRRDFRLGVVTGGSGPRVRADLERGGITGLFEVVVAADDVREPKPAPEGLQLALRTLDFAAPQALYVGDTESDYDFARAAGVAFVAVAGGFSRPTDRAAYPVLDGVTDLPEYLGAG